ncbi:MAG TPA: hypothetical protein PKA13_13560 [Geminicoccaceae bacterium]|nr:hypothetical protein [Geminicoccus sp.]HMU50797.1 hypothetical protein [Geminicoccaceae bacterium]
MHTIPPRQRATLARRIAAGFPVWAAAKGSNLPAEDVGFLMGEHEFRELIGAWAEILDMEPEARKTRLERLAHMIIEQKIAEGCPRTAVLVQRTYARKRDPVVQLAKGFAQLCEMDRARAERFGEPPATPPPLSPAQAAVEQARAAARMRPPAHPDDAAIWRQAGQLRRDMLGEQALFAAVAEQEAAELRRRPLELWEVDAIEATQVAAFQAKQAEAERQKAKAEADQLEATPPEPRSAELVEIARRPIQQDDQRLVRLVPVPPDRPPAEEIPAPPDTSLADDDVFKARVLAMFEENLAQAPPTARAVLSTYSTAQRLALIAECWPEGDENAEVLRGMKAPQGP